MHISGARAFSAGLASRKGGNGLGVSAEPERLGDLEDGE